MQARYLHLLREEAVVPGKSVPSLVSCARFSRREEGMKNALWWIPALVLAGLLAAGCIESNPQPMPGKGDTAQREPDMGGNNVPREDVMEGSVDTVAAEDVQAPSDLCLPDAPWEVVPEDLTFPDLEVPDLPDVLPDLEPDQPDAALDVPDIEPDLPDAIPDVEPELGDAEGDSPDVEGELPDVEGDTM